MNEIREMEGLLRAVGGLTGGVVSFVLAFSKTALPAAASQLVRLARELGQAADDARISSADLQAAADSLSQADFEARPQAVSDLVVECMKLEREAAATETEAGELEDLRRRALDLAMAGKTFLRVVPMSRLGGLLVVADEINQEREARKRNQTREDAARVRGWWERISRWFSKNRRGKSDVEEALLAAGGGEPEAEETEPSPPWGNWLTLQTFALAGSLALLPYMSPGGLLKQFSDDYRWWVYAIFQTWWVLVAAGLPCTLSRFGLHFARLSTHLGMLGITILVIMFSHWMLAANATYVMWPSLIIATAYFFVFWIKCCMEGEA